MEILKILKKSKYRNKIIKDIITLILVSIVSFVVYIEIRRPIPIKIIFNAILQDVKSTFVSEYSKIYYPLYYFSMQMTPAIENIDKYPDMYKILITNFFPKQEFIEETAIISYHKYITVLKNINSNNTITNFAVTEQSINSKFKEIVLNRYINYGDEELSIDSFFINRGNLYLHLVYIANENTAFAYNAFLDINKIKNSINNIKDVYAYIITDKTSIIFPVSELKDNTPDVYVNLARTLKEEFQRQNTSIIRVVYEKQAYWAYNGKFNVSDNVNELGIIIPESSLVSNIKSFVVISLVIFSIIIGLVILLYVMHYIKFFERIRREHNDINMLIKEGENVHLEFKSTLRYDTTTEKVNKVLEDVIIKSIAAFNNTQGGRLVIGVKNDGEIYGLENDYSTLKKQNKDFFELHLRTLIETAYGNAFSAQCINIEFLTENGHDICIVNINKGKEPLYTKVVNKQGLIEEKFYIRVGNSSREIQFSSEIISYIDKHFR